MSLNDLTSETALRMHGEILKQWKRYREIAINKLDLKQNLVTLPSSNQNKTLP